MNSGPPDGRADRPSRRTVLREALTLFGVATLVCAVLWQLRRVSGLVDRNLSTLIAAVFLYLPTGLLVRRKESFADYGLTFHPFGRAVLLFVVASAAVFPLFAVGFVVFYRRVCVLAAQGQLVPGQMRRLCGRFVGDLRRVRLRLGDRFASLAATQLLVVGLPEEFFFRGYLQSRLERVWPSRRRLLGAPVGYPVLVAAALFALGHVLVDFNGMRLFVFFPGLVFGWLRQASGSIVAGVLFHASSNLLSEVLHNSFFPLRG